MDLDAAGRQRERVAPGTAPDVEHPHPRFEPECADEEVDLLGRALGERVLQVGGPEELGDRVEPRAVGRLGELDTRANLRPGSPLGVAGRGGFPGPGRASNGPPRRHDPRSDAPNPDGTLPPWGCSSGIAKRRRRRGGALGHHEAGLDGLRALAVIGVLLYHGEVPAAKGGFLGISLFFTLSGFLITSILLRTHAGTGSDRPADVLGAPLPPPPACRLPHPRAHRGVRGDRRDPPAALRPSRRHRWRRSCRWRTGSSSSPGSPTSTCSRRRRRCSTSGRWRSKSSSTSSCRSCSSCCSAGPARSPSSG